MNIPIKFRAKEIIKGEYVYGDLIHCGDDVCIREHTTVDMFLTHEGDTKVDPGSVAQLLGYDVGGNEIYEGDLLISGDGTDYGTARLAPAFAVGESAAFNLTPDFIKSRHITLREGDGNA